MITLTTQELFDLGAAYGSFSVGDIDQGIHLVLPVTDSKTGEWSNRIFQDLVDQDFYAIDYPPGYDHAEPFQHDDNELPELYMDAIVRWAKRWNIEIGRKSGPHNQIDRSDSMCEHISDQINQLSAVTSTDIVNHVKTVDSKVEHQMDVDVVSGDRIFNVRINVIRFK